MTLRFLAEAARTSVALLLLLPPLLLLVGAEEGRLRPLLPTLLVRAAEAGRVGMSSFES